MIAWTPRSPTARLAQLFDTTAKTIADLAKREIIVLGSKRGRWLGLQKGKDAREPDPLDVCILPMTWYSMAR